MKAGQLGVFAAMLALTACKGRSDASQVTTVGTAPAAGDTADEQAPPEPGAPERCNAKISEAAQAIALAEAAKRQAGFADVREVDGPKALVSEGFMLSPMVPSQWPPRDCTVLFYVFESKVYVGDSVHTFHRWTSARISVHLDTGESELEPIDDVPVLGGRLRHGGGILAPDLQQWVFDAVAASKVPERGVELEEYRSWLRAEEYVAVALNVWQRPFFAYVVADDETIMQVVAAHLESWTGYDTQRSPARAP